MKKLILTFSAAFIVLGLLSQQVNRERVVVEIATGTWCQFCPGAAMGADDLVANGHDVAIIEYHNGDAYANAASNHRNSYYSVSGYPTTHFDGVLEHVGGSQTSSLYGTFLPMYQQRIAVPCDYTASIYGHNTGGQSYDVTVIIDLVSGTPPANLTAHLVLTESEIPYSWFGMSELNYVCRAMYPDHFGTTVNFAGGNQVVINYTFTIDASWNTQHIELVAFLQDESDKEILQGTMVPINNLIPLAASAAFSCSNQQPCETTSIDFYDESLGVITSWYWTFEGGTPANSYAQNPAVTYSSPGLYDVQLIVDDGTVIDTLLMEDYVEVITSPAQPSTPTGPDDLCGGEGGYVFSTLPVPHAVDYTWALEPASAGTVSGTGLSATVAVNASFSGTLGIKVRGNNQCGNGIWSQALNTTVHPVSAFFWISTGGGYCTGSQGIEVSLSGSDTGFDYELLLSGNPTGNIMAGTGSMLNFGYQTSQGIYTIIAYSDYCENTMYGTCNIYPVDLPGQAATPAGDEQVCNGGENIYTTAGASDAETYLWVLEPEEAGLIEGTDTEVTVSWSETYTGSASITVQGMNDCGDGPVSDPLEVTVNVLPEPLISGDALVCENTAGYVYSSPDHNQASYQWDVSGGTISGGQGTHEIVVSWGDMGAGTVNLTETSAEGCEGMATEFEVYIDECVGLAEPAIADVSVYPNPAGDVLTLELFAHIKGAVLIRVVNMAGQTVITEKGRLTEGGNKFNLSLSGLPAGHYSLKVLPEQGKTIDENFVIMR
jgi:PKD repeat protein